MDFRFTLFNDCTLFVMSVTIAAAAWRFRAAISTNLPFLYYAVLLGYAFGFPYSLNVYAVLAGLAITLVIRVIKWRSGRWAEIPVYVYVLWRGLSLLAGW